MYRITFRYLDRTFVFPLQGRRFVVGSGRGSDLRLPVREVSRRHAELLLGEDGGWTLRDLGSRNGVFLRGMRLEEASLPLLVEFSLGPVTAMIEEVSVNDLEAGLRLNALAAQEAPGEESVATQPRQVSPGLRVARHLVAPTARELADGTDLASLARRGGKRLVELFPGTGIQLEAGDGDGATVLFACGDAGRKARTVRESSTRCGQTLTASFEPGADVDAFACSQAVELLLALLSSAGVDEPADDETAEVPAPETARIIGGSPPMRELLAYARRLAPTSIHLLILGPSGSGKELLAAEVHRASTRREAPFVALNCAALPRDLLEAELFGIEERVATGVSGRPGRFEQADGGTLFLDEVCDMALPTQAVMLRVLEEKSVYRLGGSRMRGADVRLLSATNKDLEAEIAAGRFRSDLYYRLAGDTLRLPPLVERPGDVPLLLHHFLERFALEMSRPVAGISKKALGLLTAHSWPGNVRELENEVRRLVALAPEHGLIEAAHISLSIRNGTAPGAVPHAAAGEGLADALSAVERRMIEEALAAEDGNIAAAARRLQISRPGLYQRMQRLGLSIDPT